MEAYEFWQCGSFDEETFTSRHALRNKTCVLEDIGIVRKAMEACGFHLPIGTHLTKMRFTSRSTLRDRIVGRYWYQWKMSIPAMAFIVLRSRMLFETNLKELPDKAQI